MIDQQLLKIYVVILNWNNFADTEKCVDSLLAINDSRIKPLIVDNYSSDNSAALLKAKYNNIPILVSDLNIGYAGGMNLGIKYALNNSADYIIVSNNDIIYQNNFLSPLLELLQKDNLIGIVSPKVLYTHDIQTIYCAGADFIFLRASGVAAFQGKNSTDFGNEVREVSMAEGSCFLARKDVFEKVGLFSEDFFMYFEDLEFSDRVRKHFKIFYTPFSIIYHKGGGGTKWSNHSSLYYYYYTRNRYLYFKKFSLSLKIYILLYSLLVSLVKLITLGVNSLSQKNDGKNRARISSLIRGNLEGIKAFFN
jgi:GT2 family glycosyltransferase